MVSNEELVIHGPEPFEPVPEKTLGVIFHDLLSTVADQYDVMVDACTGRRLSAKKLLHDACCLAETLRRYGCNADTKIALCSENNLEFLTPIMASIMTGTVMLPVNPLYTTHELKHTLGITKPRIVFCSQKTLQKIKKIQEDTSFIEKIVVINRDWSLSGIQCLSDFMRDHLRTEEVDPQNFQPFSGSPKDNVAFIMCSSGTTGLPKGAMLTHFNVVTRMIQSRDPRYLSSHNIVLGLLPFYHGYGLFYTLSSIYNKHLTVMLERFHEDSFLKAIQDYRISVLRVTPPLAVFMAKSPKVENYDLSSIKEFFCGAAPLSGEIEKKLKRRLNIQTIHQGYGCTEATVVLTIMNLKEDHYRPGSCGQVLTYTSCIVRDPETGKLLGPNQVGELCFKGLCIMKGYYRNPKATQESFTQDGWMRTGDLGYYDNDRYFYIVDRLKELIKYNGYQVAPAELEAILLQHPKVLDTGVVGIPDESAGELPVAFVVKNPNSEVTETELVEFVKVKVSPQKRLRGGIIFVSSIPKNPSGKILRKELRKQLKDYKKPVKSKL